MIAYPFEAGGITTRVLTAGDTGPAVLLLHGFTSRADRWQNTVTSMAAQGYRVFAPDLPGHGFAEKRLASNHSVSGYRDFVIDLMNRLGIERASLVGTSLGGHVLAAVAKEEPDRVENLVMVCSMGLEALPAEKVAAIRAGLTDMSVNAIRQRLLSVFTDPRFVTDELVREDMLINTSPGAGASLGKFGDYLSSGFNDDLVLDDLVSLDSRFPLLMIWGENDKIAPPRIAYNAHERLPHSRVAMMRQVAHTPYIENPPLFESILLKFIQGKGDVSSSDVEYRG